MARDAGALVPGRLLDISVAEFEGCRRGSCLGGFLVGGAAAHAELTRWITGERICKETKMALNNVVIGAFASPEDAGRAKIGRASCRERV